MLTAEVVAKVISQGRVAKIAARGAESLGLLGGLPGAWVGTDHGWNLIALPDAAAPNRFRVLLNQYDERLTFGPDLSVVPNRGLPDQNIFALRYEQDIHQVAVVDSFAKDERTIGRARDRIHLEPGYVLLLASQADPMQNICRLGNIPHGNAINVLGAARKVDPNGAPDLGSIGDFSSLPIGAGARDSTNAYLKPYFDFHAAPFKGNVSKAGFLGFDPTDALALLAHANAGLTFKSVVEMVLDSQPAGGVVNIPFGRAQANATHIRFAMWIEEFSDSTPEKPHFQLQYAQRVLIEFFPVLDGSGGSIKWPHVSINTLTLNT